MILVVIAAERDKVGAHSEADELQASVDGFLGCCGNFSCKKLTSFLIVESFMEGYMLISSTDAIVTLYLFTFSSSSISFRLDAWTMETC